MTKPDRTRGRGIMAPLTELVGGSPSEEIAVEISTARERRDALAARLAAAEERLIIAKSEATTLAFDGGPDAELDKAEASTRERCARIATLTAALAQAGEQLAQLETRAEAEQAALRRQQVAAATDALADELEAAGKPLAEALRRIGSLLVRANPIVHEAGRAVLFCRSVDTQLSVAAREIVDTLRHHASEVGQGFREPIAPRGDEHAAGS